MSTDPVVIVTGSSSGLGRAATEALVAAGSSVVMAVRDPAKGERVRRSLSAPERSVVMELDLSSLSSVRSFAEEFLGRFDRLDGLLNNAGVMATPPTLTSDGVELQWATNHLGHFALTGLLLDRLLATAGSRVVAVSSLAAQRGELASYDPTSLASYQRMQAYGNSKLANLMFAVDLERRLREAGAGSTIALAAHPGLTHTNLVTSARLPVVSSALKAISRLTAQSAEAGAEPLVRALSDPNAAGGQYWGPSSRGQTRGSATVVPVLVRAKDRTVADRLWTQSIELSGVSYLADSTAP